MKTFYLAAAMLLSAGMTGCATEYVTPESSGPVTIRSTKWGDTRSEWSGIVMEYSNGYIKTMDKVCENIVPVWPGMHANLTFSWDSSGNCFHIIAVQRLKEQP